MASKNDIICKLSQRYIWWKTPEEALCYPDKTIAQVMNIGDYDDILLIIDSFGEEYLKDILTHSEIGQLNPRSWAYWHYRLKIVDSDKNIPPMPQRIIS